MRVELYVYASPKKVISKRTCNQYMETPREINPAASNSVNTRVAHRRPTEVSNPTTSKQWTRICASKPSLLVIRGHIQNKNPHLMKLRSSGSFDDVPNKARAQEVYELPGKCIGVLKCRCASCNNQFLCSQRILVEVWWIFFNQFDRNDTKGPNIHRRGAMSVCNHFWRSPIWIVICIQRVRLEIHKAGRQTKFGWTKIHTRQKSHIHKRESGKLTKLKTTFTIQEDIPGVQVSMHDVQIMQMLQPIEYLFKSEDRSIETNASFSDLRAYMWYLVIRQSAFLEDIAQRHANDGFQR